MGRPRVHGAATGDVLLANAEALLATGGIDAVSVRSVADRSDTSTRAVYTVFGDKEGLVRQLCRSGYDILSELVEGIDETDDPVADLIACGMSGFREFAIGRPHLFRLTFERVTFDLLDDPAVRESAQRSYRGVLRPVTRSIESGRFAGRDPAEVVFQFHSLCQGLATSELQSMPPPVGSGFWKMLGGTDLEPLWLAALEAFVRGLQDADGSR